MLITKKIKVDKSYRINVSGLFKERPEYVSLAIDTDKEMIQVIPTNEKTDLMTFSKVDEKNRIYIPKWIVSELPEGTEELFLVLCDDRYYLSPKTGKVL